jgi:hypothetical protein
MVREHTIALVITLSLWGMFLAKCTETSHEWFFMAFNLFAFECFQFSINSCSCQNTMPLAGSLTFFLFLYDISEADEEHSK